MSYNYKITRPGMTIRGTGYRFQEDAMASVMGYAQSAVWESDVPVDTKVKVTITETGKRRPILRTTTTYGRLAAAMPAGSGLTPEHTQLLQLA